MKTETLLILKNFSTINKSLKIDMGNVLRVYNKPLGVYATATIEDDFPRKFSIYDVNQWLSTLSLFDSPEISYDERQMSITSGRMNAKYRYSQPEVTADQPSQDPSIPDVLYSFELPKEQLSELLKASSVLGLKEVQFSDKGLRTFTSDAKGNPIDNEYTSSIENINYKDQADIIPVKVKVESLKLIPINYMVAVTERMVIFTGNLTDTVKIKYIIGLIVGN